MQVHGFYADERKKLFTVDVVADFTVKDKAGLCAALQEEFKTVFPDYDIAVNFDADYSD